MGYSRAGFDVVGVDNRPQPRYPFEFYQADALRWLLEGYDAVHASPPCQYYAGVTAWRGRREAHADLIGPTRRLLEPTGLPWVIENVPGAPLRPDFLLCGTQFGLPVKRHRWFETNWTGGPVMMIGCHHKKADYAFDHGAKQTESVYRDAMGCEWMTVEESRQAIPPAYTEYIGAQLMQHLRVAA